MGYAANLMIPSEAIYLHRDWQYMYQDVLLEEWSVGDCPGFEAEAIFLRFVGEVCGEVVNQAFWSSPERVKSFSWGKKKPGDARGEMLWGGFCKGGEKGRKGGEDETPE